jgi:peroxiredoxin
MMSIAKRNILALVGGIALIGIAAPSTLAQAGGGKPEQGNKEKHAEKENKTQPGSGGRKDSSSATAKIGQPAPAFELTDTEGKTHKLADYKGKVVVLEWFNPGCPVVKLHHERNTTMTDTQTKFKDKNVVWLAVNSGGPGKQGHGKEANSSARKDWHMAYPVLLDESGATGQSYGAKTTPHMFVIDEKGALVYAGAIDNGTPGKVGDINYVDQALTQTLAHETVSTSETKPYGCPVKYSKDKQ